MALKITPQNKAAGPSLVEPGERLYLTADRARLVRDGHPEAAILYCTEHGRVSAEEFEALGGMPGKSSKSKKGETKED